MNSYLWTSTFSFFSLTKGVDLKGSCPTCLSKQKRFIHSHHRDRINAETRSIERNKFEKCIGSSSKEGIYKCPVSLHGFAEIPSAYSYPNTCDGIIRYRAGDLIHLPSNQTRYDLRKRRHTVGILIDLIGIICPRGSRYGPQISISGERPISDEIYGIFLPKKMSTLEVISEDG